MCCLSQVTAEVLHTFQTGTAGAGFAASSHTLRPPAVHFFKYLANHLHQEMSGWSWNGAVTGAGLVLINILGYIPCAGHPTLLLSKQDNEKL